MWHETFGFIVLEALLKGVPCLVSNNVGSKDLVPNSWIFGSNNELEKKLKDLILNPNKVRQMKSIVSKLNLNYKIDTHAKNVMMELYN